MAVAVDCIHLNLHSTMENSSNAQLVCDVVEPHNQRIRVFTRRVGDWNAAR